MVGLANDLHRAIQTLRKGDVEALRAAGDRQAGSTTVALSQTGLCLRQAGRLEPA
jgi:hypothetical protein